MPQKTSEFPAKQRQINEEIKKEEFHACYLIYGEEAYLRNQNRDKLRKALLGSGDAMNLQHYQGNGINPAEVIDIAETMPFFSQRRVILIENSGFFKNGCPELADYLKNPAETVNFVFVETDVDKRKDIYKAVHNCGFDIECDTQDVETLKRWATGKLQAEGKRISPRAVAFLIDRVGTNMDNIINEMEKLVCYTAERVEITEADIDAICANWLTSQIFAMTDAIVEKNQKKAMNLYYDLLALREPPAKILSLITRQFNLMLQIKEMSEHHDDMAKMMSATKLPRFIVTKYTGWAQRFRKEDLMHALEMCVQNDEAIKTGKLDQVISVEMVLVGCSM